MVAPATSRLRRVGHRPGPAGMRRSGSASPSLQLPEPPHAREVQSLARLQEARALRREPLIMRPNEAVHR